MSGNAFSKDYKPVIDWSATPKQRQPRRTSVYDDGTAAERMSQAHTNKLPVTRVPKSRRPSTM